MAKVRQIGKSLRDIKADIAKQSTHAAHAIAQRVAPALTQKMRSAYTSGRNVYGDPRPASQALRTLGKPLTLMQSSATFRDLHFRVAGSVMWCNLGTDHAKYLIGKYKILPVGDRTAVPVDWVRTIRAISDEVLAQSGAVRAA